MIDAKYFLVTCIFCNNKTAANVAFNENKRILLSYVIGQNIVQCFGPFQCRLEVYSFIFQQEINRQNNIHGGFS